MKAPVKILTNIPYNSPYGGLYNLDVYIGEYMSGSCKAIMSIDIEDGIAFATFTRYIQPLIENMVTLDINNNPGIDKWLITNKVIEAKAFGNCVSGHCDYPIYKLHPDVIAKLNK